MPAWESSSAASDRCAEPASSAPVVVNCTGLGARELVPDPTLEPVRGQHVVVENPGLEDFFMEDRGPEQWACFFPHGAAWCWEAWPSRVPSIRPRTRPCPRGSSSAARPSSRGSRRPVVLEEQVGLRPVRPSVRLEAERLPAARCIHNYGHGRSGVSLSWGCAAELPALLAAAGGPR